ncbi:MAG: Mrp/NBP35 family ATP-binding protein [Desulfitobacterium hafniense]|nr:Mrp/NBP35 family ATP-binding protein [Desulfitobacterium hafniense]
MSNCETCPTQSNCDIKENCLIENNPANKVDKVIAVMSGKGGVGKSTISVLIAKALKAKGLKVGILDADITGPSIPRLLKVQGKNIGENEFGLLPVQSDNGIYVMSLNLLMKDEEQPVIWRGPIIAGAVKQFWKDVYWGELDYLIIDMPPGTGDVALTVMQSIPINGMVMITTPQDMVSMIVSKAVNMTKTMKIPVIGIIENMSYVICPGCGDKIKIFEDSGLESFVKRMELNLLAQLPMRREIAALAGGKRWENPEVMKIMENAAQGIIDYVKR